MYACAPAYAAIDKDLFFLSRHAFPLPLDNQPARVITGNVRLLFPLDHQERYREMLRPRRKKECAP
jgi:hypothetical protein